MLLTQKLTEFFIIYLFFFSNYLRVETLEGFFDVFSERRQVPAALKRAKRIRNPPLLLIKPWQPPLQPFKSPLLLKVSSILL